LGVALRFFPIDALILLLDIPSNTQQKEVNEMTTATTATAINSTIVSAYQNITAQTTDLNQAGLDFISLVGCEMSAGRVTGREYRASIEQAGVNPLVAVKPSHAEIIPTACEIMATIGSTGLTVAKLLSLSTRVKRSGTALEQGESLESLDERTPSIKEISDSKKEDAQDDAVTVAVPSLDALVIGFVAELKKQTKKNLQTATFTDLATPALEELKVLMSQLAQNRKAQAKK
jgi:hypothetical protein